MPDKTDEEKKKEREEKRNHALDVLKDKISPNLAALFGIEEGDYGEIVKSAAYGKYQSIATSDEGAKIIGKIAVSESLRSEQENKGKRYSGVLSQPIGRIALQYGYSNVLQSLENVTIGDVLDLVKYKGARDGLKVNPAEYMADLKGKDEKMYKQIIGSYIQKKTIELAGDSLKEAADSIPKSLEEILKQEEKK